MLTSLTFIGLHKTWCIYKHWNPSYTSPDFNLNYIGWIFLLSILYLQIIVFPLYEHPNNFKIHHNIRIFAEGYYNYAEINFTENW